jgi:hypothetical protein
VFTDPDNDVDYVEILHSDFLNVLRPDGHGVQAGFIT